MQGDDQNDERFLDKVWNPRYRNFARVHGRTPDHQLAIDKAEWPGACMIPFVEWNRARIAEYSHINPAAFTCGIVTDHAAYDAWLDNLPTASA